MDKKDPLFQVMDMAMGLEGIPRFSGKAKIMNTIKKAKSLLEKYKLSEKNQELLVKQCQDALSEAMDKYVEEKGIPNDKRT